MGGTFGTTGEQEWHMEEVKFVIVCQICHRLSYLSSFCHCVHVSIKSLSFPSFVIVITFFKQQLFAVMVIIFVITENSREINQKAKMAAGGGLSMIIDLFNRDNVVIIIQS